MELGSDATLQEERVEVLASARDALRSSGRDPGLRAAAGFLLRHLARTALVSHEDPLPYGRAISRGSERNGTAGCSKLDAASALSPPQAEDSNCHGRRAER